MATNNSKPFDPLQYGATPVKAGGTSNTFNPTEMGGKQVNQLNSFESIDQPWYKFSPQDTGTQAGLKAAGNIPQSAYRLGKDIVSVIANPIETSKSIASFAKGGIEKLQPGVQENEANFDAVGTYLKERYGSLEALQKTATEDPFAFGADVVGVLTGGATLAGRGAALTSKLSKAAQLVTKPAGKVIEGVTSATGKTARYVASQATGLNQDTITQIIKNPDAFRKAPDATEARYKVAESVKTALDDELANLSDLGGGYQAIRESGAAVRIPEGTVESVLSKYGIEVKNGKLVTTAESRPISTADKAGIEKFVAEYGAKDLSANGFLNAREQLSKLGEYELASGKTDIGNAIARDLRSTYDAIGKKQIKGLEGLDLEYAPIRQSLGQLKKDIFDKDGNLKDGAVSKIANLTGKGKENVLARMKEIVPDIEERVRVVKAIEDIESASGLKVGTYVRAGTAVGGALQGNVPLIIGAILAQPEIAVPLLRAYGYTGAKAQPIVDALRNIAEDVNNFKVPAPIINYIEDYKKNPSIGLQISKKLDPQKIAKSMDDEDLSRVRRLHDNLANGKGVQLTNAEFGFDNLAADFGFKAEDFTTVESKVLMLDDVIKRKEAIINAELGAGKSKKAQGAIPPNKTIGAYNE